MSAGLQSQIRAYAHGIDSDQQPLTLEEIRERYESQHVFQPTQLWRRSRPLQGLIRGPWVAVVAAVVTLVLFGLLAWLVRSESPIPPAETIPAPIEGDVTYYVAGFVPEGYAPREAVPRAFSGSHVVYLNDSDGIWRPDEGGFAVDNPVGRSTTAPEDPSDHLRSVLEALPDASEVDINGRPGVLLETQFSQDGVTAPQISILAVDAAGGVFEVTAFGMTRDEALAVAAGVQQVSAQGFLDLGLELDWDLRLIARHDAFTYQVPDVVDSLATSVEVALGIDLFYPRLFNPPDVDLRQSRVAAVYLEVPQGSVDEAVSTLENEGVAFSPLLSEQRIEDYINHARSGTVLSEDPYLLQATTGPLPEFDTTPLGEEIPLIPATGAEEVPSFASELNPSTNPLATRERPLIVIGAVHEPGIPSDQVTMAIWFTEGGGYCVGTATEDGFESACGEVPLSRYGITGHSSGSGSESLTYAVPIETSVVQILTNDGTYWQRPVAGYGLFRFGRDLSRPTEIIAVDAKGTELGRWEVDS